MTRRRRKHYSSYGSRVPPKGIDLRPRDMTEQYLKRMFDELRPGWSIQGVFVFRKRTGRGPSRPTISKAMSQLLRKMQVSGLVFEIVAVGDNEKRNHKTCQVRFSRVMEAQGKRPKSS